MIFTETQSAKEFNEGGMNVVDRTNEIRAGGKTSHTPLWQSIKKFPTVVGYCLALSSAILLYGYDLVIVGTVAAMPQFQ